MKNTRQQGRIKSNFIWLLLNQVSSQAVSFFGTLYLARVLGASSFGIYSFALALGQYLIMIGDFGISTYGVRQVAANKTDAFRIYPRLLTLKAAASAGCFILFIFVFSLFVREGSGYGILLWSGFMILTNALNSEWFFKGIERMDLVAVGNLIISITFIGLLFILVSGSGDSEMAMVIRAFSYIPGVVFMIYIIWKRSEFHIPELWKFSSQMTRESFVYMLTGGIGTLYAYSFILILGLFAEDTAIGLFSAAYRLLLITILFAAILPMAFFPVLADYFKKNFKQFKSFHSLFIRILMIACIPVTAACVIFSSEIISLLYGAGYSASAGIFRMLSLALPLIFLRFAYGQSLLACGFQKAHLIANATAFFPAILITAFCTEIWGVQGTAAAFLLCEIVIFSFMFRAFSKNIFTNLPGLRDCTQIGLAGIIMVLFMVMTDFHYILQLIIGTCIYFSGLFMTGALKIKQEIPDTNAKVE